MTGELVYIICVLVVLSSRSLGWTGQEEDFVFRSFRDFAIYRSRVLMIQMVLSSLKITAV